MRPILFVALLGFSLLAAKPDQTLVPAENTQALEQRISRLLERHKVPGLCAVVLKPQEATWVVGLGLADVANRKPATAETLFRIGSISKMFASLAALKLVEEGRLSLDTPVRNLVPEAIGANAWESTDPVRVVHLLEHTTGWDDLHLKEYTSNDPKPMSLKEGLALCPEARTSRWKPGTHSAYCNSGPAVTAAIVERITGQPFEEYVADHFFKPMGMSTAGYFLTPQNAGLVTRLYRSDGRTAYPYAHLSLRPAGAINASAMDMSACLRFFLGQGEIEGKSLLSKDALTRMTATLTTDAARAGVKTGWGLHNRTFSDERGLVWHGHQGTIDGGYSELLYNLEGGVGYFFSINANSPEAFRAISREIMAFTSKNLATPTLPAPGTISQETRREFQGWYQPLNPRNQIMAFIEPVIGVVHLSFPGQQLKVAPPQGRPAIFLPAKDLTFRKENEALPSVALLRAPEGPELTVYGRDYERTTTFAVWVRFTLTMLFFVSIVAVLLHALVWGTRWLLRGASEIRIKKVKALQLLATLSFCLGLITITRGVGEALFQNFGRLTLWSATLTLSTWGFAVASVASLALLLRAKPSETGRLTWALHLATSLALVIATVYLAWWGIIGYRSWA